MSITPSIAVDTGKKPAMPVSNGNTLYVGGSGEGNYTKIQHAIDDASDGGTVFVYDDSSPYNENLNVDKSINLIGEDRNTTIINTSYSYLVIVSADSDFRADKESNEIHPFLKSEWSNKTRGKL